MKEHKGMRPQDIAVLLKIISLNNKNWKITDLANQLFLSQSEISEALNRCKISGLIDEDKKNIRLLSFLDFLKYGLKYVFPAIPGAVVKGIPTAHSALPLSNIIKSTNEIYVIKDEDGYLKGESIEPLYKNIIYAVKQDSIFYEFISLIDCLRVGRVREINIAYQELKKRFRIE